MSIELQGNIHESELGVDKETLGGYCGRANTTEELCGRARPKFPRMAAGAPKPKKGIFSRYRRSVAEESSGG